MTFEEWWDKRVEETAGPVNVYDVRAAWDASAKEENEACATVCDKHKGSAWFRNSDGEMVARPLQTNAIVMKCAAAIRARSNAELTGRAAAGREGPR